MNGISFAFYYTVVFGNYESESETVKFPFKDVYDVRLLPEFRKLYL